MIGFNPPPIPAEAVGLSSAEATFWVGVLSFAGVVVLAVGGWIVKRDTRIVRDESRATNGSVTSKLGELVERIAHLGGIVEAFDKHNRTAHDELREDLSTIRADVSAHKQHHDDNEPRWDGDNERRGGGERRHQNWGHDPDRRHGHRRDSDEDDL